MAEDELAAVFAAAGCAGWLRAGEADGDGLVSVGADKLMAAAPVFEVAAALEACRQAAEGRTRSQPTGIRATDAVAWPARFLTDTRASERHRGQQFKSSVRNQERAR